MRTGSYRTRTPRNVARSSTGNIDRMRTVTALAVAVTLLAVTAAPAAAHTRSHSHGYAGHGIVSDGGSEGHASTVTCSTYAPGLKLIEEWHNHAIRTSSHGAWVWTHERRVAWKIRTSC